VAQIAAQAPVIQHLSQRQRLLSQQIAASDAAAAAVAAFVCYG